MTPGSTKTLTDCQKRPWGWVMLKSLILYDWVTRCFQRLNHPNRITCHKSGLRSQLPQPGTPLAATPGKPASTAASGWEMSTSRIFNTSSWADVWGDALSLCRCWVWGVQWGCWINCHPGSAWGRRRSMFCVWGLTTAAKQPSSTNSNHLMWVDYDGSLHGSVSDSFMPVCDQHSSLLGPFSEEWKHVSQVKDIMYFLLVSSPLSYFCPHLSVFFFLVCVCETDTDARNRPNNWLQYWKVQELKVKILWRRCCSCCS